MSLDSFLSNGSRLAIFGSFVYSSEYAQDIDFTIFTHGGTNPFFCAPQHSPEILEFLKSKFGEFNIQPDFSGRRDRTNPEPYDLDHLPANDSSLDGIFLTASFFPDDVFLINHYKTLFGEQYLFAPWLRFAEYVKGFTFRGIRENEEPKDMLLILKATEKLIDDNKHELKLVVDRYKSEHHSLTTGYLEGKECIIDYTSKISKMIPKFVSEISALI